MKRLNNIFNGFGEITPEITIKKRSIIPMNPSYETSFNMGELVPICEPIECVAGDRWDIESAELIHMTSLKRPILGNINMDTYYFFVPMRLLWSGWEKFFGANPGPAAWNDETQFTNIVPQISFAKVPVKRKSIAHYFGIPLNYKGTVSHLPFRAYTKIINDWFMNQNVENPQNDFYDTSGLTTLAESTELKTEFDGITSTGWNGKVWTAYKYADLFTRALPAPQKYKAVTMNITGEAPVEATNKSHYLKYPLYFGATGADVKTYTYTPLLVAGGITELQKGTGSVITNGATGSDTAASPKEIDMSNLYANLTEGTAGITINALETAIAIERMLTTMARAGSNRYIEVLKALYGVSPQDFRLQRPEYLGGNRTRIQINSVPQTSNTEATEDTTPGGYLYAYSKTGSTAGKVLYEVQEPGYIITLAVARQQHLYTNGLNRLWKHNKLLDFYNPLLANIPEQPMPRSTLMARSDSDENVTYGYQEAWYEYRYMPSKATGMLDPNETGSLNNWSIADQYDNAPTLSMKFLKETPDYLDRCLAYTSDVVDQFVCSFYYKIRAHRNMPAYSKPDIINVG